MATFTEIYYLFNMRNRDIYFKDFNTFKEAA